MNGSVIWFRQIGTINLSRNSQTAGYDTHKYMVGWPEPVPRPASRVPFRPENSPAPLGNDAFLRTPRDNGPDDPSVFITPR